MLPSIQGIFSDMKVLDIIITAFMTSESGRCYSASRHTKTISIGKINTVDRKETNEIPFQYFNTTVTKHFVRLKNNGEQVFIYLFTGYSLSIDSKCLL